MDWSPYIEPSTDELRRLSIPYVLHHCGVEVAEIDGELRALCPFHPDRTPSFSVYRRLDEDHDRWWCWTCGIGGDVFDLIGAFWPGTPFPARKAAAWALQQQSAVDPWKPLDVQPAKAFDLAAAMGLLASAINPTTPLLEARGWPYSSNWLAAAFGVGADTLGRVVIPYWGAQGVLEGLKTRSQHGLDKPIAMAGSKLAGSLYGAWRPTPDLTGPVLLCEGESDTWAASWALRGTNWVCLGLPAGAGSPPRWDQTRWFRDRRVFTAFDPGTAGEAATERWSAALGASFGGAIPLLADLGETPPGEWVALLNSLLCT